MVEIQQPTVDIFIVIIDQELAAWKSKNMSQMMEQTPANSPFIIYYSSKSVVESNNPLVKQMRVEMNKSDRYLRKTV